MNPPKSANRNEPVIYNVHVAATLRNDIVHTHNGKTINHYRAECIYTVRKADGTKKTERFPIPNVNVDRLDRHPKLYCEKMNKPEKIQVFTEQVRALEKQKAIMEVFENLAEAVRNQNATMEEVQRRQDALTALFQHAVTQLNEQAANARREIDEFIRLNGNQADQLINMQQVQQDAARERLNMLAEIMRLQADLQRNDAQNIEVMNRIDELQRLIFG